MLNFASCAFLIAGILLWLRRKSSDKARTYLAIVCLFSGFGFLLRLFGGYTGVPVFSSILPIQNLIGGLVVMILFYIYPIEIMSPGWFSPKRTFLLSLPCLLFLIVLFAFPIKFRELSSFGEIFHYIRETNVWFRLLMLLTIQLYVVWVFVIPHNWRKSSVSNRWVRFYSSLIFCMGVLYALFVLTGFPVISIIHLLFCFVFCMLITYQELFIRMKVPVEPKTDLASYTLPVIENFYKENENAHPVWIKLNRFMKEKELWRNPDMTQENLAALLEISRPTLSSIIRENGFSGYKEYLNRCRIEELLKIINSNNGISIQEAFFHVGYRSRTTAMQYFYEYLGCTPIEYLNRLSDKR